MIYDNSIAIWTEGSWALGTLYKGLKRALSNHFKVDFYDWDNPKTNKEFWTDSKWKQYDIILGNSALTHLPETMQLVNKIPQKALNKMIINVWAEVNHSNKWFIEYIKYKKGPIFTASTLNVQKSIKEVTGLDTYLVRVGWHLSDFYPMRKISYIKTIGLNGNPTLGEAWCDVKRPDLLKDIGIITGCKWKFIHGKNVIGTPIYDDIDMYVCTSKYEAGPSGIAECALSKIPVISTPVGFANIMKNIKTFSNEYEAAKIIKKLNKNPYELKEYIDVVYEEAKELFDWNNVIEEFWLPLFKQKLKLNNKEK